MNIAVILSGGHGSRFGTDIPKQFINLAGKNIIEYTINAFEQNQLIDKICIVADPLYHEKIKALCVQNHITKFDSIISGGIERKDSSYNAIKQYENIKNVQLIFHDAVRPFVSQEIITQSIKALKKFDAVDVAIPTADTIIQIDSNTKTIKSIPKRSELQRGQTPQAFKLEIIKTAHEKANSDMNEPQFSDDCGLVLQYLPSTPVYVVDGEEKNIKITYPEDLLFAEKLIQLHSTTLQYDIDFTKLKNQVIVVYGGHSGIGYEICTLAKQYGAHVYPLSLRDNIDITKSEDIKQSLLDIFQKHNKIDSVINCAASLTKSQIIEMDESQIEQEILTNYIACVKMAQLVHPFLKQSHGNFLLFTSSSYTRGRAGYSLYSSTKAAIVNFAEAIAHEWEHDNIKVNVINPARTDTPMRKKYFGKEDPNTLLEASTVAKYSLQALLQDYSGLVIDVKKEINQ